jgi:hypothetical protein
MEFEHVRVKIRSLAKVARASDRVPKPAREFFELCFMYFRRQKRFSRLMNIRAILIDEADLLIAFRACQKIDNGSFVIAGKIIKTFPTPIAMGSENDDER